jgi:hypothetical protein
MSGIPLLVVEDSEVFIYFLDHDTTFPHTVVQFSLSEMTSEQKKAYSLLLKKLHEAGFATFG